MKQLLFFASLIGLTATLVAQKPMADRGLSFGIESEKSSLITEKERLDATTGKPLVIYRTDETVAKASPLEMAMEYLGRSTAKLGLTSVDLANLEFKVARERPAGTTVRLKQSWKGVPVWKGGISLTVFPDQSVGMVNNEFVSGVNLTSVRPAISSTVARNVAAEHLQVTGDIHFETQDLVIVALKEVPYLAHRIVISSNAPQGEWESFVDAQTGELLKVSDIAFYYRHGEEHGHGHGQEPETLPFPMMVNGTGNVFDPDPLTTAGVSYFTAGYSDANDANSPNLVAEQVSVTLLDITFSGGQYHLIGPYAEIVDHEEPLRGLFSQASPDFSFNRSDNAFEAVNVYYHVDASMRYLNETLGLAVSPSEYTGGVQFDPSGVNNADQSYYTGGAQRIIFGDGGVDDAEDSDVIHHELGHGLHDWFTDGGLSQVNGLSEGSGDYWAASYNRSFGLWAPNEDGYDHVFTWDGHNEFWNGRRVDDSRSYPNGLVGQIHNDGQIWASAMMQVWDAVGKQKTDMMFWSGIAMTSGNSSQNDAAVAVYEASRVLPGCTNEEVLMVHTILSDRGYTLPAFEALLPVDWLSVTATPQDKTILVQWATVTETDNDYFTVERSTDDGATFAAIGRVAPNESGRYDLTDASPYAGLNHYRIRQTDFDGEFSFSEVVTATLKEEDNWSLSPNPVVDMLSVRFPEADKARVNNLQVLDLSGREVMHVDQLEAGGRLSVSSLPPGVYLLRSELGSLRFVKK